MRIAVIIIVYSSGTVNEISSRYYSCTKPAVTMVSYLFLCDGLTIQGTDNIRHCIIRPFSGRKFLEVDSNASKLKQARFSHDLLTIFIQLSADGQRRKK